jgi:hypothetical protein
MTAIFVRMMIAHASQPASQPVNRQMENEKPLDKHASFLGFGFCNHAFGIIID